MSAFQNCALSSVAVEDYRFDNLRPTGQVFDLMLLFFVVRMLLLECCYNSYSIRYAIQHKIGLEAHFFSA